MNRLLALTALACGALTANAHFIFLELPPEAENAVHLRFEEEPGARTRESMQKLIQPMTVKTSDGDEIAFEFGDGALMGKRPEGATLAAGTYDYGVLDKTEQGRGVYMLKYHAKAAASAKEAKETAGLPLEATAKLEGQNLTCTITWEGEPVADAEVVLNLPGVSEPTELKTDAGGNVTALVLDEGWIGVRASLAKEVTGEHDGKSYELVRHYTTLTFPSGTAE